MNPDRLENLPLLPSVVVRLMGLDPEDEDYFDQVYRLIAQDPTFAARVLRSANSAQSGPAIPIASLHDAISRLGAYRITSLVTAVSVTRVFIPTKQKHRELWTHSLQVATAARRIAQLGHASRKEQETAYVAGLLHDLGRFIMLEQDAQMLLEIDESCWSNPDEMLRQELAVAGIDHTETGRVLCQAWKMPLTLVSVVRHHHDDGSTKTIDASLRSLIETVQMADRLSVVLMRQNRLRGLEPGVIEQRIETLCRMKHWHREPVSAGKLAEAVPEIVEESDRMIQDLMLGATG